jgi:hypothetical protein
MNRINRFVIAGVLAIGLISASAGVWAAPVFQGTVPPVPPIFPLIPVTGECLETVNMSTAVFTVKATDCIVVVELVNYPAGTYVPAPEGKVFIGDTFEVTTFPEDAIIQACHAYPPEFADKKANIYRLNDDVKPNVWVEISDSVISDGTICGSGPSGVFSLIGNP